MSLPEAPRRLARPAAVDVVLAAVTFGVAFAFSYGPDALRMTLVGAVAISVTAAVVVGISRRRPGLALVAAVVLTLSLPVAESTFAVMDLVLVFVSWRAVVASTWPPAAVAMTCLAALTVNDAWQRVAFGESFAQPSVLYPVLLTALSVGLGLQTRRVRTQNAELLTLRDADRLRAVSDERRRIARDLHDVAAHHLSALAVRNGLALRVGTPDGFVDAARFSARTAKEALESMREVVHVLSDDMPAPVTPGPRLADLDDVITRMAAAGLHVEGPGHGEPDPAGVPDEVQAVAVRIVQEALSNVLQHRGPGKAWVDVECNGPDLLVRVEDDGTTGRAGGDPGSGRAGRGVTGMRERAEAVGGRLVVGPSPRGGWRVEALLPAGRR